MYIRSFLVLIILFFSTGYTLHLYSQSFTEKLKEFKLEPFVMLQFWSTYTLGQEIYDLEQSSYEKVENRLNFQVRRARLGFRGEPYERLKFSFVGAYDLIGRDVLTGTIGGVNPPDPSFTIWDAFIQWKISPNNDYFHITAGYFRPQFSRESITSGWSTNSFEKSMSQNYIRKHLVGTGPGRAVGINLGGLLLKEIDIGFNYNIGVFNPLLTGDPNQVSFGHTVGKKYAPLIVGRAVIHIGDPEQEVYKIGYDINYYNLRKGLSIGLNGSYQGSTDLFEQSSALGLDFLFNWDHLNLDGDIVIMTRAGSRLDNGVERSFEYNSQTGHIRVGWNFSLKNNKLIEPAFMYMHFKGGKGLIQQANADAVRSFSGTESTYDLGINWYLNRKHLKIALHYTWRNGESGNAGEISQPNQYFSQRNAGTIKRGDYVGLGLSTIF